MSRLNFIAGLFMAWGCGAVVGWIVCAGAVAGGNFPTGSPMTYLIFAAIIGALTPILVILMLIAPTDGSHQLPQKD